ncbi:MAG: stringent starvation protein A [uncultured bacterium]|nr:MAG: stringent starvation protein A [uncultured bacterium]OGT16383.1 MAG: stringent starvation protein A [Gammaproteobacteria bacterium RIFCSPHIGHO2_02_FULL_38_33]OGT24261.1 MAG: stringent starvation protein A [Gammaproteobacteria bacterium RIFCSPHIGHO2_12_38_15]OGT68360.1 MAG: stringent starvation protein A [Gammaproteobacteria bacterium RIFCSPLOWO2_02_FULL_38_11]OGT77265.1 MAG: stringent starvation protein A [Gammaproteobacteria bacterium RIFCSPLOWO2_12_FULL_38_14]
MAMPANKRSTMTLYSNSTCPSSHKVRIVLAEKGVTAEIINVSLDKKPEELWAINPDGTVPTLVDRELILYESNIILEYLDERFPHPPLMPVYPVGRAKLRLMMFRVEKDWYGLMRMILSGTVASEVSNAKKELREGLLSVLPLFEGDAYFLNDDFSLIDCCLAPLLWRLSYLGIDLGAKGKAIYAYGERLFSRNAFKASLTENEEEMRKVT